MKKFMAMTSIVAMLASQGHAYGQSVIGPQPNSAYTAGDMPGCHIWHVNANPFALTQAEAMRKLPALMKKLVSLGVYTQQEASLIQKQVLNTEGKWIAINKGYGVDWMSGGHDEISRNLCFEPSIRYLRGVAVGSESLYALSWIISLPNRTINFSFFEWCKNFGAKDLMKTPPPPPVAQLQAPDCFTLGVPLPPGTDHLVYESAASFAVPRSACTLHGRKICSDCNFEAVERFTGERVIYKNPLQLSHPPAEARWVKMSLPIELIEDGGHFYVCAVVIDSHGIAHQSYSTDAAFHHTSQRRVNAPYFVFPDGYDPYEDYGVKK
jgi:hypothetical protein